MIFLILATTVGFAQDKKQMKIQKDWTPEQMAEKKADRLAQTLDLTDTQKKRVYALQLEKAKMKKAKMSTNKEMHKENYTKYNEQMKEILTVDQYAKWNATKKDNRGKKGKMKKKY